MDYLRDNNDAQDETEWFQFWENVENQNIDFCVGIVPIMDDIETDSCLCELQNVCDTICGTKINDAFYDETFYYVPNDYIIPKEYGITNKQCQDVLNSANVKSV